MIEFPVVLVINCGSSSVKFSVLDAASCDALMTGIADGINTEKAFISVNGGEPVRLAHQDYEGALAAIALELEKRNLMGSVALIGHRIAHGGDLFSESTLITEEVMAQIRQVSPLAPLHNYANLSGVEAAERLFPGVQQVAVFDTSFHQTMPPQAYLYGLPYRYFEELGVRRYGFHGTSHRYVSLRAAELLGRDPAELKVVSCHLGNGSSLAAVKGGRCVDTSMGLTPLAGLPMGTRAGDMDVGVVEFIANKYDMTISEAVNLLNKESGMLGLSGVSSDFRDLEQAAEKENHRATVALEIFEYRVRKMIAEYAAAMGGVDVVVFTAGVGENAPETRAHILHGLEFMGITCDPEKNNCRGKEQIISQDGAPVTVMVVPTNEELMIAQDTMELVLDQE